MTTVSYRILLNKVHCSGALLVQKRYRAYHWRVARGLSSVGATHASPLPASSDASFRCSSGEIGDCYVLCCQMSYHDAPIHRNAPRPRRAQERGRGGGVLPHHTSQPSFIRGMGSGEGACSARVAGHCNPGPPPNLPPVGGGIVG
jgi:hypothetical protein